MRPNGSPDPLAGDLTNPQSLNRYAYVLNNPTTLIDPLGLETIQVGPCMWDTAQFWTDTGSGPVPSPGFNTIFEGCYEGWFQYQELITGSPTALGNQQGSGGGGGSPPKPAQPPLKGTNGSNTTVCFGPAKITGVAQGQAPGPGALSAFGIPGHQFGGVAVKPSLYGLAMPGPRTANLAAQRAIAQIAPLTTIIPQDVTAPTYGGPPPPYSVTDIIGPASVRNTPGQQFDLYDFPSAQAANQATLSNANAYIVVQDPNYSCPAGYVRF